jgi:recombination protein RecT
MSEGKALAPVERIKNVLATKPVRSRFEEILGSRAQSFMSSIITAVSQNNQLAQCDPTSVISAAAIAATMDLPINPGLGFAHIVPYKDSAQFQIGWKGFVQLAMRSGKYKTINLTPVLEGQLREHNPFTGEMEFAAEASSDKQIGYLLYFKLLNGYEKYFYMTREQCEAHAKRYSASYKKGFGMWKDDFEAMALKTVCKLGLSKYGILSVDMQKALETDQAEIGSDGLTKYVDSTSSDATPRAAKKDSAAKLNAINEQIQAKKAREPEILPAEPKAAPVVEPETKPDSPRVFF